MQILNRQKLSFVALMWTVIVNTLNATSFTRPPYPFYAGVIGGYGSTTWNGLVPRAENQNLALKLSSPTEVSEGGSVWGMYLGCEPFPYFALEASFIKYPTAFIHFDSTSLFSFTNNDVHVFRTHTQSVNLMAKLMIPLPSTPIRIYSSAGVAGVYRKDMLVNDSYASPTFGFGANYNLTTRLVAEVGANYTAGFGEPTINPSDSYFPFLYAVFARIGFRF